MCYQVMQAGDNVLMAFTKMFWQTDDSDFKVKVRTTVRNATIPPFNVNVRTTVKNASVPPFNVTVRVTVSNAS